MLYDRNNATKICQTVQSKVIIRCRSTNHLTNSWMINSKTMKQISKEKKKFETSRRRRQRLVAISYLWRVIQHQLSLGFQIQTVRGLWHILRWRIFRFGRAGAIYLSVHVPRMADRAADYIATQALHCNFSQAHGNLSADELVVSGKEQNKELPIQIKTIHINYMIRNI